MSGTYATFLTMKTIIKEMPTSFFDKLSEAELEKFNELIQATEALKPQPVSSTKFQPPKTRKQEASSFQPKNIIFCLSMKRIFTSKRSKYIRYSFALIRCLLKEAQRTEKKMRVSVIELHETPENLEHRENKNGSSGIFIKDPGSKMKSQKKICRLLRKRNDQFIQNKFFLAWLNLFIKKSKKNINFASRIQKILKKRLQHVFQTTFHNCPKHRRPQLSIDHCDTIPLLEAKENTQSNHNTFKRELNNRACVDETENFEDFEREPKKNTKMIKKKKVLLRGSKPDVTKLEVVNKNHSWVQAFAMLKWKKVYFSVSSNAQIKDHIGILVTQLLSNFTDKYQKNIKSIFFENLKVKYSVIKQSRNFRISLFTSIIARMQKSKLKISKFKAFQMIYIFAISYESSIQTININIHKAQETHDKAFLFYKFLKKVFEQNYLKKKVAGFVAIQNFYFTNPQNNITEGLNNLFILLQRLIYIKKYMHFYELKDEAYIKQQKAEILYESIEIAVDNVRRKQKFSSFFRLKACSKGSTECLIRALEKFSEKLEIKYSFLMISAYATHFSNFKFLRNTFATNLITKIYFKRLSSCLL